MITIILSDNIYLYIYLYKYNNFRRVNPFYDSNTICYRQFVLLLWKESMIYEYTNLSTFKNHKNLIIKLRKS